MKKEKSEKSLNKKYTCTVVHLYKIKLSQNPTLGVILGGVAPSPPPGASGSNTVIRSIFSSLKPGKG